MIYVVLSCHVYIQQSKTSISSKGNFQLFLWKRGYLSKFLEFSRLSVYLPYVILEAFGPCGPHSAHVPVFAGLAEC